MSPPPDQAPAVLESAETATMPLPDGNSDSPDIVAKNDDGTKTNPGIKTDEAQEVLAPLTSQTDTSVMTSITGSLATIHEQTDSISSSGELPEEENTSNKSTAPNSPEHEISVDNASTEPPDVLPLAKSESDQLGYVNPDGLASQQKDPEESAVRIKSPGTVVTTSPTLLVSGEGGDDLNNGASEALASASTDNAADDRAKSEDDKFVDPNDKDNIEGDVIKFFYTSSTRKRLSSPVAAAPGCCNPRLHRDSDLYIKAKGGDGKVYVFEVVSSMLEKASPKFEAMIYGSHTRGNKEEWVWELDDNP